jgi:hypothetical protein
MNKDLEKRAEVLAREYATDDRLVIPFTPQFYTSFLAGFRACHAEMTKLPPVDSGPTPSIPLDDPPHDIAAHGGLSAKMTGYVDGCRRCAFLFPERAAAELPQAPAVGGDEEAADKSAQTYQREQKDHYYKKPWRHYYTGFIDGIAYARRQSAQDLEARIAEAVEAERERVAEILQPIQHTCGYASMFWIAFEKIMRPNNPVFNPPAESEEKTK